MSFLNSILESYFPDLDLFTSKNRSKLLQAYSQLIYILVGKKGFDHFLPKMLSEKAIDEYENQLMIKFAHDYKIVKEAKTNPRSRKEVLASYVTCFCWAFQYILPNTF